MSPLYRLIHVDRLLISLIPKYTYLEIEGNMGRLQIKKDFIHVVSKLSADGITLEACEIETEELRELIVIWSSTPWKTSRATKPSSCVKHTKNWQNAMYRLVG